MNFPTKQLVDADIVCYTCGFSADKEGVDSKGATKILDNFMESILFADEADFFLTGQGNFRTKYPWYKAHRKDTPKPKHLHHLRDYVIDIYGAVVSDGEEADDLIGKAQKDWTTCITSTDKDLDQIPGWHFNWRKSSLYWVTREQGLMFFLKQMIMGDRADNVKGIPRMGEVKADKALKSLPYKEGIEVVKDLYTECGIHDQLKENAEVLWIRR